MSAAQNLIDFMWRVPKDGFRWVIAHEALKPDGKGGRYLVPVNRSAIPYLPLVEHTGLFRQFSATSTNEEGVLAFANKFGFLGSATRAVTPSDESGLVYGEKLDEWQVAIDAIRPMVSLWNATKIGEKGRRELARRIHWNACSVRYEDEHGGHELIISDRHHPELFERFPEGDLAGPAMYLIQGRVNQALAEHRVGPKLLWDPTEGAFVVRLSAQNLVGALWLQFTRAIEGDKNYKQCLNCRDWIEVGGNRTARSDKKFCSPTCKSAFHRANNEQSKHRERTR